MAPAIKKAKRGNVDSWIKTASSWIAGKHGRSLIPPDRFAARVGLNVTTTTNVQPTWETPRCYSAKTCISRTLRIRQRRGGDYENTTYSHRAVACIRLVRLACDCSIRPKVCEAWIQWTRIHRRCYRRNRYSCRREVWEQRHATIPQIPPVCTEAEQPRSVTLAFTASTCSIDTFALILAEGLRLCGKC